MLSVRIEACSGSWSLAPPCRYLSALLDDHICLVAPLSHALSAWRVQSESGILLSLAELWVELIDTIDRLLMLGNDVEVQVVYLDGLPGLLLLLH